MSKNFSLPEDFTVTAHTGCEGTTDNSVKSITKAFECGADIFEADVQFNADGVPVLTHDAPVGNEPTLEDAFAKLAEYKNMRFNIDIKKTDNLKAIPFLARKYGVLDRIFYTGINIDFVRDAKETPEIEYYLNSDIAEPELQTSEYLASLIKTVTDCGATGINCNHENVTKGLVDAFHKNGLLVSVWTCNEENDIIRMLKVAPDNITTRRPSAVRRIMDGNVEI